LVVTALYYRTAPPSTQLYPLSLHVALPISRCRPRNGPEGARPAAGRARRRVRPVRRGVAAGLLRAARGGRVPRRRRESRLAARADRKSTRLNSSHVKISYAVFCLKKKNDNE